MICLGMTKGRRNDMDDDMERLLLAAIIENLNDEDGYGWMHRMENDLLARIVEELSDDDGVDNALI